jgi:diguanylate cyclase (GGDEF)-like protein/PAS domain S-box-containing protein
LQAAIFNLVVLSLLVFLFAVTFRVRPDDRLRCWIAGWLCVLAHSAAALFTPADPFWHNLLSCISFDALALAGICFVVSTMILSESRAAGLRLGIVLAVITLPCLSLAVLGFKNAWVLSLLILVRQAFAIRLASRARPYRRTVAPIVICVCVATGGFMLYGAFHGDAETIVYALLGEILFVTAIDFWNNGWQRTLALKTMVAGLVSWAAVFPVALLLPRLWSGFVVNHGIWNIPKWCVAVGMILVVLEEDARAAHALGDEYRLLFDANPHPLWIFEIGTLQFLSVNQAALDLHGYTREEFLRMKLPDILDPSARPQALAETVAAQPVSNRASRHVCKDGHLLPMDISAYNIVFKGRQCRFVLAIDVSEREMLERQLVSQARHDALTGLPNRMLFREQLAEAVRESIKAEEKLAILCIDIRRFKRINDTYGPRIGDECLKHVANILGARVRAMDLIARTGGDEFGMVLTGVKSAASVEQAAIDLREVLTRPLLIEGYKVQLAFSMGLAVCPDDGTDATALWRGAESALRQAQSAGGGQAIWLSPELSSAAERQIELEAYMRKQLAEGGFHLAYQPFYAFDGSVQGLEALLRLDHPTHGPLSPSEFIPIAEETGLIVPLGQWVLEEVCRQLRVWKKQGMRLVPVAVNVSGLQLMHLDFAGQVMDRLRRYEIDPKLIHLEVTESVLMRNLTEVAEQMHVLTSFGIAFSIDDFGTGHSSLGRLHQLPISVLKIDQSFIAQLCVQGGTYSIVQAIISMAHALGHHLVAEGVETPSQLARLRDLDCDLVQGFLLSRPVPPEVIPVLVAVRHKAFFQISSGERTIPLLPEEEDDLILGNHEYVPDSPIGCKVRPCAEAGG